MKKLILAAVALMTLAGCGFQSIPQSKNKVDAALAEITNEYKRRADLVPNLVNTVKGFAKQEQGVLLGVTEARAKATSMNIDPSKVSPQQLAEFQKAQGQLSQALGRLLMLQENYPTLKSDVHFRDLAAQLEGTENRISVARNRYIQAIQEFNNLVTVPPTSWTNSLMYHHEKMPQFTVDASENVEKVPGVTF